MLQGIWDCPRNPQKCHPKLSIAVKATLFLGLFLLAPAARAQEQELFEQGDLELAAQPAYRTYELGEAVFIHMMILNPNQEQIVRIRSKADITVVPDGGAGNVQQYALGFPGWPFSTAHPAPSTRRRIVCMPPVDISCKYGERKVLLTQPGTVTCTFIVTLDIKRDEKTIATRALTKSVKLAVTGVRSQYTPALDMDLVNGLALHEMQYETLQLTVAELEAIETFALANNRTAVGRNLLYQLAQRRVYKGYALVPPVPREQTKLSFDKVLTLSKEERQKLKEGMNSGEEKDQRTKAVKVLLALLEDDDGTYAFHDEAALLLATEYVASDKADDAAIWCRRILARRPLETTVGEEAAIRLAALHNVIDNKREADALCAQLAIAYRGDAEGTERIALLRESIDCNAPLDAVQEAKAHGLTKPILNAALKKTVDFSTIEGAVYYKMPLRYACDLVATFTGHNVPVVFRRPEWAKKEVNIENEASRKDIPAKDFLELLLSRYDLRMEIRDGYILVREAKEPKR